jgi:hypothetical protein
LSCHECLDAAVRRWPTLPYHAGILIDLLFVFGLDVHDPAAFDNQSNVNVTSVCECLVAVTAIAHGGCFGYSID